MSQLLTFEARDAGTIRDGMLRVIRNGLIAQGVSDPNVTPGSDWYVLCQAVANELEVVEANAIIKADAQMPDSAEGSDLYRQAAIYGLSLRAAGKSAGPVVLTSSASVTVAGGATLIDGAGLRFEVTTGGVYANGATIPIQSIDTGEATNHAAGDVLRWESTPAFADEKVVVGAGGLVNGRDAESDEGLRQRLYAYLRNPPRSGNWEHVAEIAEESSAAVSKAFVYPAVQGPATVHVACVAEPTATSKLRAVDGTTMSSTVGPYVTANVPEHVYVATTTVTNVTTSVALQLTIPDAPTAAPPGPGGGWLDAVPWPDVGATGQGTRVTTATSSTQITVDAVSAPVAGVTRVSWLSPTDWLVRTARVVTVSGVSGAYVITLDAPFGGVAVGDYVWPAATNGQAYADAVLEHFAGLGPGEKSSSAAVLIRGYRRPRPITAWPYSLGPQMLRDLVAAQSEVTSATFLYRTDGTTSLTGASGVLSPAAPVLVTDPPKIFVPDKVGFYRST